MLDLGTSFVASVARDPDALRAEVIDVSAPTLERCEM